MSGKKFEIIDEHYVGYYQGTAFLISNGANEWYIWEKKEKAQELVDLLNSLSNECNVLQKENIKFLSENTMLKTTILRNEEYINRLTHQSEIRC